MQTTQGISDFADVQFFVSRQIVDTFHISHALLPVTVAKLSALKNSPGFWPTLLVHHKHGTVQKQQDTD